MNRLPFPGCTPEPLLRYLKGLGIFRLIALGPDPGVRADWAGDQFTLTTALRREDLLDFFLNQYSPTPVLAPWNGGSGFWDNKAAGKALKQMESSTSPRFAAYRKCIKTVRSVAGRMGISKEVLQKEKRAKAAFLRELRSVLPDEALDWLDATTVIAQEAARFAPVLGTGGNDGNLDYSANFMQRLADLLPLNATLDGGKQKAGPDPQRSLHWLQDALFAEGRPPLMDAALGQYHPGGVGGPNSTAGFEGRSLVNPWEYVLMVEGLLALAGAAARRLGSDTRARAAFPFTVSTTVAGWGTLADAEESTSRAEIWLPLWQRPARYTEVQRLFGEGRAHVGHKQARTGLDFVRAVAALGVDRGIEAFQRYGFVQRNGLAYLAVPLGRVRVREQPHVRLLDEIDSWLSLLRRLAAEQSTATLKSASRIIDRAVYAYCEFGGADRMQAVLVALGKAERLLAVTPKFQKTIPPLNHMSTGWLDACDDGSATFRVARALASIYDQKVGDLRVQLEPVTRNKRGQAEWAGEGAGLVAGGGDLCRTLVALLERRLLEGDREGTAQAPIQGRVKATLADVHAFLQSPGEDERLLDLLAGLVTLRWNHGRLPSPIRAPVPPDLSRAYALLKLLFLPEPIPEGPGRQEVRIRPEAAVVHRLRSGQLQDAVQTAYRRLWAKELVPLGRSGRSRLTPPEFVTTDVSEPLRLAAALLVPIDDARSLVKRVIHQPQSIPLREGKGSL